MKALVVHPGPHFSVADVNRGILKGLNQNGVDARDFAFDRRLDFYDTVHIDKGDGLEKALTAKEAVRFAAKGIEVACFEWLPDVVIVVSGFFVPPEMYPAIRAHGHKLVLICTESPYEDSKQIERAPLFDLVLLNDPTNIERFRAVNPNTHYMPHSYDPDIHFPAPPKANCLSDFAFVGTGYPSRAEFFESVNWDGIDATFAGNWQNLEDSSPLLKRLAHPIEFCCDNTEAVDLYRGTKVSANLYRQEIIEGNDSAGWSMGPREVELAATETFFLRESRGEGDEVLDMVPTFDGVEEFEDHLRWWIIHEDVRQWVAGKARAAIADRTFKNSTAQLLRHLERIPSGASRS